MTMAVERTTMVDLNERANLARVFGAVLVLLVEAVMPIGSHFENRGNLVDSGIGPDAAVAADLMLESIIMHI